MILGLPYRRDGIVSHAVASIVFVYHKYKNDLSGDALKPFLRFHLWKRFFVKDEPGVPGFSLACSAIVVHKRDAC